MMSICPQCGTEQRDILRCDVCGCSLTLQQEDHRTSSPLHWSDSSPDISSPFSGKFSIGPKHAVRKKTPPYLRKIRKVLSLKWADSSADFFTAILLIFHRNRKFVGGIAISIMILATFSVVSTVYPDMIPNIRSSESFPQCWTCPSGMEFRRIPAGSFVMGSPESEENRDDETPHYVTLTQPFYIGLYEVTQKEWESVMNQNLSTIFGDKYPVEQVSWNDCREFVKALNTRYRSKLDSQFGPGWEFALPTEAQWEYACRAGTTGPYAGDLDTMAWYGDNTLSSRPIGQKAPNAWGLYDMHGNVCEWCQDWRDTYPSDGVSDPTGPDSGSSRVIRGGSWNSHAWGCRSARRRHSHPAYRYDSVGLRLVIRPMAQHDPSQADHDERP